MQVFVGLREGCHFGIQGFHVFGFYISLGSKAGFDFEWLGSLAF